MRDTGYWMLDSLMECMDRVAQLTASHVDSYLGSLMPPGIGLFSSHDWEDGQ